MQTTSYYQGLKKTKTKEYDNARHGMQAPVAPEGNLYTVHWHPGSYRIKEKRSPFFFRKHHARRLLKLLQEKYGKNMAIIYIH